MSKMPKITRRQWVARSRLFHVEELDLTFSNGEHRTYERLVAGRRGAVMAVPLHQGQFVLIREYSAGTEDYQLAFPKGLIEEEESALEAANRELKEEIGFGAKNIRELKRITLAPGYLTHKMSLVLATDLYPEKLDGDEPEPLEVVMWPMDQVDELLAREDFTEARSIAALLLVKRLIDQKEISER